MSKTSYSVIVSCGNGAGTSLMMKMTVEDVLKKHGLSITNIHHCAIAEGKSSASRYDLAFVPLNFLDMFKDAADKGTIVIGLRNVLSAAECKEKLIEKGVIKE